MDREVLKTQKRQRSLKNAKENNGMRNIMAQPLMEADTGVSTGASPAVVEVSAGEADKAAADTTDYKALYEQEKAAHTKLKASFDKASSDIAGYKKAEKERMTDEEKKAAEAAEREARFAEMQSELSAIKTQNVFARAGYGEDDYKAVTEALVKAAGQGASELAEAIVKFTDGAKERAVKAAQASTLKEGTVTPDGASPAKESEDVSYAKRLAKGNASEKKIEEIKKLYS